MFYEGTEQLGFSLDASSAAPCGVGQDIELGDCQVCHRICLEPAPQILNRVEFGGIWRQEEGVNATCLRQEGLRLAGTVHAETIIGLFKAEVIRNRGPWRNIDEVEYATLEWVDWFNHRRLLELIGNGPPAEYEGTYESEETLGKVEGLKQMSLRSTRGGSIRPAAVVQRAANSATCAIGVL